MEFLVDSKSRFPPALLRRSGGKVATRRSLRSTSGHLEKAMLMLRSTRCCTKRRQREQRADVRARRAPRAGAATEGDLSLDMARVYSSPDVHRDRGSRGRACSERKESSRGDRR